ncbi:MAG TPA: YhbY family RNA-binding protein [Candidatus Cloacimonadota bacterium]|nr:YhbY family RNA-binding protein [Candidatus Cloacimonadota bacterium]HPT71914.1 YhbY family RNA-binding protein [Candidatus Cloacimonadota bacterium]
MNITNSQRSFLRKRANALKPYVMIGKNGVTSTLIQAIDKTLEIHELVKIRFQDFQDEKQNITDDICSQTAAMQVDMIGNVVLLYRQNPDPAKRSIVLPV